MLKSKHLPLSCLLSTFEATNFLTFDNWDWLKIPAVTATSMHCRWNIIFVSFILVCRQFYFVISKQIVLHTHIPILFQLSHRGAPNQNKNGILFWHKPALISYCILQILCSSLLILLGSLCCLKWQTRKTLTKSKIKAQN